MPRTTAATPPFIDLTIAGQRVPCAPKRYECVAGHAVAKPYPNVRDCLIRSDLIGAIHQAQGDLRTGTVLVSALFHLGPGLYRRPDLAFLAPERWPVHHMPPPAEAWAVVPDLAVEFVGSQGRVAHSLRRVDEYFAAGVRLLWVFCTDARKVYAYRSPRLVIILDETDELSGEPVLPGFKLPLVEVFEMEADKSTTAPGG